MSNSTSTATIQDKLTELKVNNISISKVPHCDEIIPAMVYDVYDGDTCKIIFMHGGIVPMKINLRILGIDTPEIRPRKCDNPLWALEKHAARLVRDVVADMIKNRLVLVKMTKWDKFGGRILGNLYFYSDENPQTSLADYLIQKKLAKCYEGGKKITYDKTDLEHIILCCNEKKESDCLGPSNTSNTSNS